MKQPAETGAPANAKLLERHASEAEGEVMRVKAEIATLTRDLPKYDGDTEKTKDIREQLQARREDLNDAYELWFKLSKQVREYDKAVSEQRRDGEKISRLDVEAYLTQSWRFQRLGRHNFIIAIAQEAIHCKDEQDFYAKYAELIRECETNNLRLGIENEKFPAFVIECYERSL